MLTTVTIKYSGTSAYTDVHTNHHKHRYLLLLFSSMIHLVMFDFYSHFNDDLPFNFYLFCVHFYTVGIYNNFDMFVLLPLRNSKENLIQYLFRIQSLKAILEFRLISFESFLFN